MKNASNQTSRAREPWNKGKLVGQKAPIKLKEVWAIRLDPCAYGTHSMRRTKATPIYKRKKNLRAVQLLPGHAKLESNVRYLGIEVDDALEMAEESYI